MSLAPGWSGAKASKRPSAAVTVDDPAAVSPASGLDNANFVGKYKSQLAKQQMLMGNFSPAQMWAHSQPHGQPVPKMSSKRPTSKSRTRETWEAPQQTSKPEQAASNETAQAMTAEEKKASDREA